MSPGTDWAEQARRLVDAARDVLGAGAASDGGPGGGPGAPAGECRRCPLCQVIAVLRGERPEVAAALADVLGATADALHAFAAAPDGPRSGEPTADAHPGFPGADPPPVVQRIEIA